MSEADLYGPVAGFFESHGYLVNAEVGHCDVTAKKDGLLVVIELKQRITLKLVLQAVQRQEFADAVYVAVPAQKKRIPNLRDIRRLFKRLELGLLLVSGPGSTQVEIAIDPRFYARRRNRKRRSSVLKEIAQRPFEGNVGGSPAAGGRLTAYRMKALRIADLLHELNEASPAQLHKLGAQRAGPILQKDYYGWFQRVRHGVYTLNTTGHEALVAWKDAVEHLRTLADQTETT